MRAVRTLTAYYSAAPISLSLPTRAACPIHPTRLYVGRVTLTVSAKEHEELG